MKLAGKVALVTGAARRLGKAIALGLAHEGVGVVVHYGGSRDQAEATAAEIEALGAPAWTAQADLRDPRQVAGLITELERRLERLDLLVNSAAGFEAEPFDAISASSWDAVMALNLRAPFLLTQGAARLMARHDRTGGESALVVNMADLSGLEVWRGYAHHGVSKAALIHLTRAAALELAPTVRVNAIVPGAILPPPGTAPDSDTWRTAGGRLPLQRTGDPEQVVLTLLYLARADFVTGAVVRVDGGEHLISSRDC